jgi:IMP dehydrogenase
MLEEISVYGGIGFVTRFQSKENRIFQSGVLGKKAGFSINIEECYDKEFIDIAISNGTRVLLLDTAVGHTEIVVDAVKHLRSIVPEHIHIMTGNVSSYEAYKDLILAGADSVRVGIGGGAACTTRVSTGFGVPVLASIMDIYSHVEDDMINGIISDGGIKQNGDIVKAIAAGASAVMMGSMFAGHEECDANKFRGLASLEAQLDRPEFAIPDGELYHIEGVSGSVNNKGKVNQTILGMRNGLQSGISYSGEDNIRSFQDKVTFIKVSRNSLLESNSRI